MSKRFANENLGPREQALAEQMNLDESAIPAWTIPPVASGNPAEFLQKERPRLLNEFARLMYGAIPPRPSEMQIDLTEEDDSAFGGLATRRELSIRCGQNGISRTFHMLLYIPNKRSGKVPVFFGLNFRGNHTTTFDPKVLFYQTKLYPTLEPPTRFLDTRTPVEARGEHDGRFCFEACLKRGYAVATICYWELYPDHPFGFKDSILSMYYDEAQCGRSTALNEKCCPPDRSSGAISAWAWGISRGIDALETQSEIDPSRIAVHGHSRLGKTALWAGANDTRIALAVSVCSGTCGAKLSHRYYGEDFSWINLWNSHWVVPAFEQFVGKDATIPIDQHQLIGCIAPRLTYVFSASDDCWADPKGEFLAAKAASEFYRLFGMKGLSVDEMPDTGVATSGEIGYYLRKGEHNCTPENWNVLLDYADMRLK